MMEKRFPKLMIVGAVVLAALVALGVVRFLCSHFNNFFRL